MSTSVADLRVDPNTLTSELTQTPLTSAAFGPGARRSSCAIECSAMLPQEQQTGLCVRIVSSVDTAAFRKSTCWHAAKAEFGQSCRARLGC